MTTQLTMPLRVWAEMALLALFWGFSFLAIRVALDEVGPWTVVAARLAGAMVVLWLWVLIRGYAVPRTAKIWVAFMGMGFLNNVIPFGLIAWGQQSIETGLASILNASTAVWGVLIAALFLPEERLTWRRGIGVLIGFLGVSTAIGLEALRNFDLRSVSQLAILGAAVSYGFSGVWARRNLRGLRPEVAAAGMLTCSSLVTICLAGYYENPLGSDLHASTLIALAYLAVFATAAAYLVYYRVMAQAGSGNVMLVTLLVAPVAIVAGAVVLGEALPPRAYAGFAMLALGLVVLDGRLIGAKKPLAPTAMPR
ncbi:DMT family transporter [Flavimaricola marinus]|uniref:Putative DMT superfamily transporter inner membrane protein n=1 Tax=Flavimaricola marinus TaxID=1819565 RepID=A0A238LCB1_9RHOB|nr:DMT family transporter [Flavimaricola marinus]SMY07357.1 putative DMT superfamily transporter inner membrane protein [Flavimaricola marinus]